MRPQIQQAGPARPFAEPPPALGSRRWARRFQRWWFRKLEHDGGDWVSQCYELLDPPDTAPLHAVMRLLHASYPAAGDRVLELAAGDLLRRLRAGF